MKNKDIEIIINLIDSQGFDYAFDQYDHMLEKIKDNKFQQLRESYSKAYEELATYIDDLAVQLEESK